MKGTNVLRTFDLFIKALCILFGLILAMSILLVFADVVLRNLGVASLTWTVEVAEYSMYAGTFLAAPWVLRAGGHVRVELLTNAVPRWCARLLDRFSDLCGLVVCGFLLLYGAVTVLDGYRSGTMQFKTLIVPEWILLLPIPIGSALLGIVFLLRLFGHANIVSTDDASLPQPSI